MSRPTNAYEKYFRQVHIRPGLRQSAQRYLAPLPHAQLFFIVKLNAAFLSNLLADKATATAKLSAYSDYFKTHDETSQPIKVFIIHYNVIAHKIKTEI